MISVGWTLLALTTSAALPQEEETTWVIRAQTVYTAAGDPIEDGAFIEVEDGIIEGVGSGSRGGDGALECFAVTPGLIDLSVRIASSRWSVEESDEVQLAARMADAVDLFSYRWGREARSGVTSALVSPPDNNVLGGLGIALKTAGEPTLEARLLRDDAVLRGSFGDYPARHSTPNRLAVGPPRDFRTRRPATRMATEWVMRDAFYKGIAAKRSGTAYDGAEVLESVLSGERPMIVQAWATQDIRTAAFFKAEFSIPRMIIDGAAEAWREPELLRSSGASVVLPPMVFGQRARDNAFYTLSCAKTLHDAGIPFALSGHGAERSDERLAYQPAHAMRGGLPFEAALEAVTMAPARMIGVEDRVGSIEAGKDADLVLWSGRPFEPSSRVVGVLVSGRLVLDPRPTE